MDRELTLRIVESGTERLDVTINVPNGSHFTNALFDGCTYIYQLGDIKVSATLDSNIITYTDSGAPCESIVFTRD